MLILIFLFISQALTFKLEWDGKINGTSTYYVVYYERNDNFDIWKTNETKTIKKYLPVPLTISNYLLVNNAKIIELKVDNFVPGGKPLAFKQNEKKLLFVAVVDRQENYFKQYRFQTCQLAHCELGLTLYPLYQEIHDNIFNFNFYEDIIYVKYITDDMNFKLFVIKISGDDFPLVLCPYVGWVSLYGGTEFIPHEGTNGIIYDKFRNRQIILPAYPRYDDNDVFVCGLIKYKDGSQLSISYIMEVDNYYDIQLNRPVNRFEDIWKCSFIDDISNYDYFLYSKNNNSPNKMKYIKYDSRDSTKFYYNDTVYIYKNDGTLKDLKENGYEAGINIVMVIPTVKTSCKRILPQLKFKLRLVSANGTKLFDSKNEPNILEVSKDMLNKELNYKCKIFVEEASNHSSLSNYYDDVMEVSLVSKDDDGNKIFHDTIVFKDNFDGFKKYECEIRLKDQNFKYKYAIKNLSFITIPLNTSVANQNEEWRAKEDVVIQCQRRLSNIGEIDRIKVEVSENFFVEYSNLTSNGIFNIEGDYVRTNYENLIKSKGKKNSNIKSITTICIYKVMGGKILSIVKSGTVLQKTIITQKNNKSDKTKKNSSKVIIIGLSVGIGVLVLAIIIAITTLFVVRCLNKKRRKQRNSSLSTLSSFSSYANSSISGSLISNSRLSTSSVRKSQSKVSKVNK
uniref:Fibronectin type-III domain-containing protein n=1 Tax=Strongyloides venezuelensis TaxID=75913 RepID=A0A0K0F578_STRVS